MKLLMIGGTRFLGRWIVEEALARGWEVTLFNRGNHADVFPNVRTIMGDREEDLMKLEGENWDAVIDTCGFHPHTVRKSVKAFKANASFYAFVSTISVYAKFPQEDDIKEEDEVLSLTEEELAQLNLDNQNVGQYYGHLKYLCEQEVLREIPDKSLIVRPGLIVGPYDPTDRFTYWATRLHEDREILAPGRQNKKIQFIDVRDLAAWIVKMTEGRITGVYNATGPKDLYTMQNLINDGKEIFQNKAKATWVSETFLLKENVQPWIELPLWIPETTPENETNIQDNGVNIDRALNQGLSFRAPKETIKDTYDWVVQTDRKLERAGLKQDKEKALLEKWNSSLNTSSLV
ncbi:MAG TPA: NAD-dependent epimerase/dehydratase family protein [Bacillus sp. (in: firmicutes)]|uniref:NAD-dependent epimerase/dehydratase family protein n=1 Tax=Bacillus litorisediminis TaxID=2922713 RepID=UPI001FABBCEC|nr:NAD-dependent epimerase/dehydratase family protein [Bacillus litorisediminis]HWO77027.1 NAD-dependent epimerase/dehydratase family protein [Bacillus sp. (in: firmicutes)]